MRRPLRSKRAMISPVRPRANASGLTRMRVRSIGEVSFGVLLRGRLEGRRRLGLELDLVAPLERRRRLRLRGAGVTPGISASQYGQMRHVGSSGLAQFAHGSLSLRMQLGQRRKSRSTSVSQCGHRK